MPQAKHTPALGSKLSANSAISLSISLQLCPPVVSVRLWLCAVQGAAMPEATVNKDRNSQLRKYKIRTAMQRPVSPPSHNLMGAKQADHCKFGFAISV